MAADPLVQRESTSRQTGDAKQRQEHPRCGQGNVENTGGKDQRDCVVEEAGLLAPSASEGFYSEEKRPDEAPRHTDGDFIMHLSQLNVGMLRLQVPWRTHPGSKVLFLGDVQPNPPPPPIIKLTSCDDTALDPVIDDVYADPQARSELLHGEFIRAHQASRWNGVLVADPFDHGERKRLAMGAAQPFLIEVCDDLQIGQLLLRQSADLLDDFRRTTYRFGSR